MSYQPTLKQLRYLRAIGEDLLLLEDGHCLRDHTLEACHIAGHPGPD